MPSRQALRLLAGRKGQVPDPEGSDGVEGEAPARTVGIVETPVPDAGADLERVEGPLDFPAQRGAGGVGTGLAPGGWQHPARRLAELALLGRAAAELKALQMFGKSEIAVLPDCAGYMGFELRCWKSPDTPLAIDDVSLGEAVLLVARLGASRSRE